jgi:hypothetical protein
MSTLSLSGLKDSIYTASVMYFIPDTAAAFTLDLTVSMNTKLTWCTQSPFIVNTVA